jgi:hypothetical protein
MQERVLNFLNNWVDANIRHASFDSNDDVATMQHRYLTDAVAAGLKLDEVNTTWPEAENEIGKALRLRRDKIGDAAPPSLNGR